jgi:uncharacterized protein
LLAFSGLSQSPEAAAGIRPEPGTVIVQTDSKQHTFRIELAATPSTRSSGLMYRRKMPDRGGMLFDFVRDQQVVMWMKNTYIPLDMLFIGSDGRIVNIAHQTVPHSLEYIRSAGQVRAVLEINGGLARRMGINPGDRVWHKIFPGTLD